MFILIGNFMGQFRHNYFVGIKTPWTLADEDVWQKTHRLGARVWVIGGIVCFIASFINSIWGSSIIFSCSYSYGFDAGYLFLCFFPAK
ncbi:SdpI family protein [Thermosyntropha lipolytica]|uniref:SdpI family protein n=1 Tax=Thermosyntropha lipolytica TaxID=54294 RepID=UPI00116026D0|nr:SdpI family protein [Thermosyntropha lipolytica]